MPGWPHWQPTRSAGFISRDEAASATSVHRAAGYAKHNIFKSKQKQCINPASMGDDITREILARIARLELLLNRFAISRSHMNDNIASGKPPVERERITAANNIYSFATVGLRMCRLLSRRPARNHHHYTRRATPS